VSDVERVLEHRTQGLRAVELRDGEGAAPRFTGTACVYGQRVAIGNPLTFGWYEEIAPGACAKTLQEQDIRMLVDHDSALVVARKSAGTLLLAEDAAGVNVDAALDQDVSYVRDLVANLRNGNVSGMSIGFWVIRDEWTTETVETSDGQTAEVEVRLIREIKLQEVSAVTFPAYDATTAGLRSMMAEVRSTRDSRADASGADREPGEATRGDTTPAAGGTGAGDAHRRRHRALAIRHGQKAAASPPSRRDAVPEEA